MRHGSPRWPDDKCPICGDWHADAAKDYGITDPDELCCCSDEDITDAYDGDTIVVL